MRLISTATLLALVGVLAPAGAQPRPDAGPDAGAPRAQTCVRWTTEARYRPYGYDHWVHITNSCDKPARCRVTTNVNPNPTEVRVPVKETVSVVTFQGSPAREFSATVTCTLY